MIVEDRQDISGMFSKAGRLSQEMYTMLQEKEFILSGKRRHSQNELPHIQSVNATPLKVDSIPRHRSFKPHIKKSESTSNVRTKSILNQPFHQALSRQKCQELTLQNACNNQKFGMYNPKFHLIFEKSPLYPDLENEELKERARMFHHQNLRFQKKNKGLQKKALSPINTTNKALTSSNNIQKQMNLMLSDVSLIPKLNRSIGPLSSMTLNPIQNIRKSAEMLSQAIQRETTSMHNITGDLNNQEKDNTSPSKKNKHEQSMLGNKSIPDDLNSSQLCQDQQHRRIAGPISFQKQINRKPLLSEIIPHEKRFEYLDIPSICSKSQKLANISFDTMSRSEKVFGSKTGGLDYNVKYNMVLPRANIGVIDYSKQSALKSQGKPIYTLNEQTFNIDYFSMGHSKSQLLKKITAPKFSKMQGRDRSSSIPKLDSFDISSSHKY